MSSVPSVETRSATRHATVLPRPAPSGPPEPLTFALNTALPLPFSRPDADVFVPEPGLAPREALARTTHLCIAAHQDDIEIMAYHGIAACFGRTDRWFSGVVVTDGAGSPRHGVYAAHTDAAMQAVRRQEQRKAAFVGDYSIQIQLAHPSSAVKRHRHPDVLADLATIIATARAEVVYLHQPADKHDTHVAVLGHALAALRALPPGQRPKQVLGCEVWRDLDWLPDAEKVPLDVSAFPNLASSLIGVFGSQISGGKRYDLAIAGRRTAHATFHTSHATDRCPALTWAMDLTPLVNDPTRSVAAFTQDHVERFRRDISERITRFC